MTDTKALRELLAKAMAKGMELPAYESKDVTEYTPSEDGLVTAAINALPALLDEVEALRSLVASLNDKLDATHTHRCIKCDGTVTEETARRQALEATDASTLAVFHRVSKEWLRQYREAAFREGAEKMREAAANLGDHNTHEAMKIATAAESHSADTVALRAYAASQVIREYADAIRALPLPEDK